MNFLIKVDKKIRYLTYRMAQLATLPSGLRYIWLPDECPDLKKNQQAVFLLFLVAVGGKNEPIEVDGISHLLEHLMFSGTKQYPQILKSLDRLGAQYNAHTSKELTSYHVWVSARKALTALRILVDMLFNTPMTEAKIKKEKQIVRQEMREFFNNHQAYIHTMACEQIFRDHPLTNSVIGTPESLERISQKTLTEFYHYHYRPDNMVLVIQGQLPPGYLKVLETIPRDQQLMRPTTFQPVMVPPFRLMDAQKEQEKQVARPSIGQGVALLGPPPQTTKGSRVKIKYYQSDQSIISLAFPIFGFRNNLKYHAQIISILVGGNFSSHLYKLRETHALVYGIHSRLQMFVEGGYFYVKTTTRADAWLTVIDLILETLSKLPLPTAERLAETQDYILNNMVLNFKDPHTLTEHYGKHLLFLNEVVDLNGHLQRFKEVTLDDLQKLQPMLLNMDRAHLSIIGPHGNEKSSTDQLAFQQLLKQWGF